MQITETTEQVYNNILIRNELKMNKINDNLNFYGNYFHGIQDIKEHRSAGQVAIGVLKIISL